MNELSTEQKDTEKLQTLKKTVWITLAGFAVSGVTLEMGFGFFILLATIIWLVYRITLGWYALNDEKPVNQK